MLPTPSIRRLRRHQIDTQRWDAAVDADPVPLLYGLHWWLDAATDYRWEGLVVDDYRVVLALPRLRRFRVLPAYIRPPYTQQVGPYGTVRPGDTAGLLRALPGLPQIALPLRPTLRTDEVPAELSLRKRTNYVLRLEADFATITKEFSSRMRSYVRKHADDVLQPIDRAGVVALCRDRLGGRGGVRGYHFERLDALIAACLHRDTGELFQLTEDGKLLCAGFYPRYNGRTFNIAPASTELGLKRRGMTRMLARILAMRSGTPGAAFDFEGSELDGVREYFASFGGLDEGYYLVERRWFDWR